MVTKLPEVHVKEFEILEKFCHTNGSFCQSPDSRRVTVTVKYPGGGGGGASTETEVKIE